MARRVVSKALRRKLGKLIPLLGSDKVGERAGAAAAIKRLLTAEGLDFHDLADNVGPFPEPTSDSFAQGLEPTESKRWLDDLLAEEGSIDFHSLTDDIGAPPEPPPPPVPSGSFAQGVEPTAPRRSNLDEILAELDEALNPSRR
jgi:hypothetical protein